MTLPIGSEPVEPERWQTPVFLKLFGAFVIMLILMGIVSTRLGGRSEDARVNATRAVIRNYDTALKHFEFDNGFFPTTEQGLKALETKPTVPPEPKNWKRYLDSPVRNDPWDNAYVYKQPGRNSPNRYDLFSLGRDGLEGTKDDITNWK